MMNDLKKYPFFMKCLKAISVLLFVLLIFVILSLVETVIEKELYLQKICISNDCLKLAYDQFEYIIKFSMTIVSVLTSILTTFGIFIAALTFVNTSKTNALNSHINHFKIFSDYVSFEVSKRSSVRLTSIDVFNWYNLIFEESKVGSIAVSLNYISAIKNINFEISKSNDQSKKVTDGSYKYKDHQKRMIEALSKIGIILPLAPRNDFIMIEGEFHSLVQAINNAFCSGSSVDNLLERSYI
ncbi:retron Ec48 family effector membrane protein [Enterovibrio makurazakiensis]|uniref:retron Ec48 family effector membrane protein n=1 Tax=Enterovibrio makurazakiensis TaxID=2910232 RepID=UPI003D198D04